MEDESFPFPFIHFFYVMRMRHMPMTGVTQTGARLSAQRRGRVQVIVPITFAYCCIMM